MCLLGLFVYEMHLGEKGGRPCLHSEVWHQDFDIKTQLYAESSNDSDTVSAGIDCCVSISKALAKCPDNKKGIRDATLIQFTYSPADKFPELGYV